MSPRRSLPVHAAAALGCWLIHAGNHLLRGSAPDLLWACNVAAATLPLGCFLGRRLPVAVAFLWLSFGTPIWLLDLATGAGLITTSPLVHVVAPVIAAHALRQLGWPRGAWLAASGASALLLLVSRLGPSAANVNLAFRVHGGWETRFRSHPIFIGILLAASAAVFFLVDLAARRLFAKPR